MVSISQTSGVETEEAKAEPDEIALVRYGLVPQVARFGVTAELNEQISRQPGRGCSVVVESERGVELGQLLEVVRKGIVASEASVTGNVVRLATDTDQANNSENRRQAELEFFEWQNRIDEWKLQLQIIDMEWTLDRKNVVLYVLNDQDAETTRLALLAAAGGYGVIHVQPVNAEGIEQKSGGGGCGSGGGGCGSGGCGS